MTNQAKCLKNPMKCFKWRKANSPATFLRFFKNKSHSTDFWIDSCEKSKLKVFFLHHWSSLLIDQSTCWSGAEPTRKNLISNTLIGNHSGSNRFLNCKTCESFKLKVLWLCTGRFCRNKRSWTVGVDLKEYLLTCSCPKSPRPIAITLFFGFH